MEGRTNMEENVAKFSEKLKELLAMAKKEKECTGVSGDQRLLQRYGTGCGEIR